MEHPEDILNPLDNNNVYLPIILTHAVTFLVGVVGNSIVIATWAGRGRAGSPTSTFLVSLAVADLLLLLVYVPLETLEYFVITWDAGGTTCKLGSYVEMLSGMASVLNLTAVSIERFLVIVFPMKARRICTLSNCRRGLLGVWGLALVLAAPVLVTKSIYPITYYNNATIITAYYCWDANDSLAFCVAVYQLVSMFLLPAVLMSVCYVCVIRELWTSTKTVVAMTQPYRDTKDPPVQAAHPPKETSRIMRWPSCRHQRAPPMRTCQSLHRQGNEVRQARKQVIKMLLLVIIFFLLCWGPRLFMNIAIKLGLNSYSYSAYTARVACYLLSFIHSTLNPFIYGFMSSNFRRMMLHSCSPEVADALTCGRAGRTRRSCSDSYDISTSSFTSPRRSTALTTSKKDWISVDERSYAASELRII